MKDVASYYPDIATVRELDRALVKNWGIDFFADEYANAEHFWPIRKKIKAYIREKRRACRTVEAGKVRHPDETNIMIMMADVKLNAAIASRRRHYILDAICLSSGLISNLAITGPVLDIGCHNGTMVDVLARRHTNKFKGIDPISPAIQTAEKKTKDLSNVTFECTEVPFQSTSRFNLLLCIDVLNHLVDELVLETAINIARLTNTGGYVILSTGLFHTEEWLATLTEAFSSHGMGYVFCDVIGGYGDIPPEYGSKTVVVLQKGLTERIPVDVIALSNHQWDRYFKDYANDPLTPLREKTQSFERAQRGR